MSESGCLRDVKAENLEVAGDLTVSGNVTKTTGPKIYALTATTGGVAITSDMSGGIIHLNCGTDDTFAVLPTATVGLNYKIILSTNAPAIAKHAAIKAGPLIASTTQAFHGSVFVGTADAISGGAGDANERVFSVQNISLPTLDEDTEQDFLNLAADGTNSGGRQGDVIHLTCLTARAWHVKAHLTTSGVLGVAGAVDVIDDDGSPT